MKNTFLIVFALILTLVASESIEGQESRAVISADLQSKSKTEKRHSINVEFVGRTFLFSSLNYEYQIKKRWSLGAGLGLIGVQAGDIIRNIDGGRETGRYLDIASTQMIYINHFIGKNRHKLLFTGGITNFLFTSRNTYPSETQLSRDFQPEWNLGVGYQYSARRAYFRLTGYIINMPDPSGWFPDYLPWLGLTVGYKL